MKLSFNMDILEEIEKDYRKNEWLRVQADITTMRAEVPLKEKREMRLAYLNDELQRNKKELLVTSNKYVKSKKELPYWHLKQIQRLTGLCKTLSAKIRGIQDRKITGVSQSEIEVARLYPLKTLIENRRNMALCPFHSERTPSLNIKDNFYYCHGCGEHGDVISFIMKTENLLFEQAVRRLI